MISSTKFSNESFTYAEDISIYQSVFWSIYKIRDSRIM